MSATEESVIQNVDTTKAAEVAVHGRVANMEKAVEQASKTPEQIAAEKKTADEAAAKEAADAAAKKIADEAAAKAGEDTSWQEEWVSVGNEHADAAIELMKAAGVKPVEGNAIFDEAIKTGDLNKVKWDLLEARLGKAQASLVRTGITAYYDGEYKEQQAVVDHAYAQVGGKEGWDKLVKWAHTTATVDKAFDKQLAEYRRALEVGGFAGKAAVDALKVAYEAAPGNSSLGGKKMERGSTPPANHETASAPLSRADYYREMSKAGGDRAPAHVVAQLRARRQAGMAQGI
ncbi:scaffolding protein [Rhizobium phage Palo]|uniref:Scaffolding protein n=1 Tax=Rhizobium phage Palo TaxID=2767573 RepID=A0A7L8G5T4_9CAUD|nr:scaffolding protein [Rhizobium phage Palo]